jgi:hypothetical protein
MKDLLYLRLGQRRLLAENFLALDSFKAGSLITFQPLINCRSMTPKVLAMIFGLSSLRIYCTARIIMPFLTMIEFSAIL